MKYELKYEIGNRGIRKRNNIQNMTVHLPGGEVNSYFIFYFYSFDSGVESGSLLDEDMDILNYDEMVRV